MVSTVYTVLAGLITFVAGIFIGFCLGGDGANRDLDRASKQLRHVKLTLGDQEKIVGWMLVGDDVDEIVYNGRKFARQRYDVSQFHCWGDQVPMTAHIGKVEPADRLRDPR